MNQDLRALIPTKGLIAWTIVIIAGFVWYFASSGERRSANPFDKNYDSSLNNSGPKLKRVTKVEIVTESTDSNGVTHQTVH